MLPEDAVGEVGAAELGVARVDLQRSRPPGGDAQLAERAEAVDRVADDGGVAEHRPGAGLDRAPGEVGVLAAGVAAERGGVEAADPLQQRAGVEDVAGLKRRVELRGPGSCA